MSAYRGVKTSFTDIDCLKKSLEKNGKHPVLHQHPVHLEGYQGDQRKETAELVIPRKDVGTASNDIGFKKQGDGTIQAVISAFDSHRYDEKWLKQIKRDYTELTIGKKARILDLEPIGRTVLPNGKVRMQFQQRG